MELREPIPGVELDCERDVVEGTAIYDDYVTIVDKWINEYQFDYETLGKDDFDNEMYLIKSGDFSLKKPIVYMHGSHSGRECHPAFWIPEFFNMLNHPEQYDVDPQKIQRLKNNFNFIAIPILVPSSWRWLDRPAAEDNSGGRANQNGVDINRNFPQNWDWTSEGDFGFTYKGPSAASEKETQKVMAVFEQYKPFIAFDVHTNETWSELGEYHGWSHSGAVGDIYHRLLGINARNQYEILMDYDITPGTYAGQISGNNSTSRGWMSAQTSDFGTKTMSIIIELGHYQTNIDICYHGFNMLYMHITLAGMYLKENRVNVN